MNAVHRKKRDQLARGVNQLTVVVEDDDHDSIPYSSRLGGSYALPETEALGDIISMSMELVELGQRFNGMRGWTYMDQDRVIHLRGRIAELWCRRREQLAELKKIAAER